MRSVTFDDLEPTGSEQYTRYTFTEALETSNLAANRYHVPPGGTLPGGLHAHMDQEEIFVILEGTAVFDTLEGSARVSAEGAIRFAPGEFHSGRNDTNEPLEMVALGAPKETEDVRVPATCPACVEPRLRLEGGGGDVYFSCPNADCGRRYRALACPHCAHETLSFVAIEGTPVVRCQECASDFEQPPLEHIGKE